MTDRNTHLDEGTIHAWLDGALAPDESARVDAHAAGCDECAALVAEARGLVAASSRILSSLDTVPAGVIPGAKRDIDQLAALRARRGARSRTWFRDPRFVAAASLIFIAGTFSVVWRATSGGTAETQATAPVVADQAQSTPPAAEPAPAPSVPPNEAKMEIVAPARDVAAKRLAANPVADSAASTKVAVSSVVGEARGGAGAANEVRRENVQRADVGATRQAPVQVQAQAPPPPQAITDLARRQSSQQFGAQQQLRADSSRVAAAASAERLRSPMSLGARAAAADASSSISGCYDLRDLAPGGNAPSGVADTVVLHDDRAAERSDPSWFVARRAGDASSTTMRWRQVDSVTVELRGRSTADSSVVRFLVRSRVLFQGGGQVVATMLPDVQGLSGVTAKVATKVRCPN